KNLLQGNSAMEKAEHNLVGAVSVKDDVQAKVQFVAAVVTLLELLLFPAKRGAAATVDDEGSVVGSVVACELSRAGAANRYLETIKGIVKDRLEEVQGGRYVLYLQMEDNTAASDLVENGHIIDGVPR
ncbi:hypothetical protein PFISCL1PPCAC_21482, partial [Pristionchus fissidentatus]